MSIRENPKEDLIQRAIGAYLGLAIGDALGATVEFMTPREIVHQYRCHKNIIGGGWLNIKAGRVTDDTEMSLSLGRSILKSGGVDAMMAAQYFSDWMSSKPIDMGNTVRRGIMTFRNTGALSVAENEQNAGNGACMRTLPIALYTLGDDDNWVRSQSKKQAHVTHNNLLSDVGTETVIEMIQSALIGTTSQKEMREIADNLVLGFPTFSFTGKAEENPSGYIVDTLKAVFQALFETRSFEDCLVNVVNRGGDADTTGAIAGMIAGAFYGAQAIPMRWTSMLDIKVKTECVAQAQALIALSSYYRSLS
jgi:ADP-ribosyl-[dinitrogen reductase] hydrolase